MSVQLCFMYSVQVVMQLGSAITIDKMEKLFKEVKSKFGHAKIMVSNCYGEFVETKEPTRLADLIAGSLIKNPGGSLALSGGYLAGNSDIITMC